jgi:hypothetical protein
MRNPLVTTRRSSPEGHEPAPRPCVYSDAPPLRFITEQSGSSRTFHSFLLRFVCLRTKATRIVGPKRDEGAEDWRKIHNEKHYVY